MIWKNILFSIVLAFGVAYVVLTIAPPDVEIPTQEFVADDLPEIVAVAAKVDAQFESEWKRRKLRTPDAVGTDGQIARRLTLGLAGTIPSLQELRKLDALEVENPTDWFVNYLLNDDRYSDYVAERLARAYVGTEDGPFILYRRRRFVSWLADQLRENVPYDDMVRKLILENGLWTDAPAVNFYTVTINNDESGQPDPIRLAGRTSRAFLGLRIDCVQCHDDALGTLELGDAEDRHYARQTDFHQLAAAFASVRQTAAGLQNTAAEQEYRYQLLNQDDDSVLRFQVPFRADLVPSNGTSREKLATWITHPQNRAFSRAIVNRVWALMFGKPLIDPVDDIPLHSKLPPGMEILAHDFSESGFDLRRLIRIIAQTRAFQHSPHVSFETSPAHDNLFAVFPVSSLRPEQVAGSLVQSSSLKTINDGSNVFQKLTTYGDISEFIERYGDSGEDEFRKRSGTIQQKHIMMNGKVVSERSTANGLLLNSAAQISRFAKQDDLALSTVFRVALSRDPTPIESDFLSEYLSQAASPEERTRLIEDILWSLFNKREFQTNH